MDKLLITGGRTLEGRINISGAKNAALPILCASILSEGQLKLRNVPELADTKFLGNLLETMGANVSYGKEWKISTSHLKSIEAPYDIVRKMRASVLVLGPLLARYGEAKVHLPGGCAIGTRPIDIHLSGLEKMGAHIDISGGMIHAKSSRLIGNRVELKFPSVGATENLLMAACLAKGESVLENVAREPEIVDLANCLKAMGAEISGEGSSTLYIQGKDHLSSGEHTVMGDRIEASSHLVSIIATKGRGILENINSESLSAVLDKIEQMGVEINRGKNHIEVLNSTMDLKPVDITTLPYPGFPTDSQAQFMVLLSLAQGVSTVKETIFENRFMHVAELNRMGAQIEIKGNTAFVKGKIEFSGAPVMASDLRASSALISAALAAKGESTIQRIYHLDRGYEKIEKKLQALGAQIERVS